MTTNQNTTEKLGSYGAYGLHVIQYPSLRWGYVGTIPEVLCKVRHTMYGPQLTSMVFDTKEDAIKFYNTQFPSTCEHYFVPIGEYDQNGSFVCLHCKKIK